MHVEFVVAPIAVEDVPTGHVTHVEAPPDAEGE